MSASAAAESAAVQIGIISKPGAKITVGQITRISSAGAVTVNLGGNDQAAALLVDFPLTVGDNVLVLRQGSTLTVIGPLANLVRPVTGTVASAPANSYTIVVSTSIGAIACDFVDSYTPATGDSVIIMWAGSTPIVIGATGKTGSPPAPTPPPMQPPPTTPQPPPARPQSGRTTFQAGGCGTYRSGDWRDDANGNVIQGTAPGYPGGNDGAWFYGGRIASALSGARVTGAKIWLGRVSGGNYGVQTVHLYRVTNQQRPNGDLSFTSLEHDVSLDIGQQGWFTLPVAFAQALVDNGGAVGVKAPSGPYVRLYGLNQSGIAGALRISWSKSG